MMKTENVERKFPEILIFTKLSAEFASISKQKIRYLLATLVFKIYFTRVAVSESEKCLSATVNH